MMIPWTFSMAYFPNASQQRYEDSVVLFRQHFYLRSHSKYDLRRRAERPVFLHQARAREFQPMTTKADLCR